MWANRGEIQSENVEHSVGKEMKENNIILCNARRVLRSSSLRKQKREALRWDAMRWDAPVRIRYDSRVDRLTYAGWSEA